MHSDLRSQTVHCSNDWEVTPRQGHNWHSRTNAISIVHSPRHLPPVLVPLAPLTPDLCSHGDAQ